MRSRHVNDSWRESRVLGQGVPFISEEMGLSKPRRRVSGTAIQRLRRRVRIRTRTSPGRPHCHATGSPGTGCGSTSLSKKRRANRPERLADAHCRQNLQWAHRPTISDLADDGWERRSRADGFFWRLEQPVVVDDLIRTNGRHAAARQDDAGEIQRIRRVQVDHLAATRRPSQPAKVIHRLG